jgi:hypothetical protein
MKDKKIKISVSARIPEEVVNTMERVSKNKDHRFYDRKNAYIINKILVDWANQQE